MKEFDKWFERWLKNNSNCIKRNFYHASKIASYDAWKAALEWVLLRANSGFCQCGCIEDSIMNEFGLSNEEKEYVELWNKIPEKEKK